MVTEWGMSERVGLVTYKEDVRGLKRAMTEPQVSLRLCFQG